MAKSKTNKPPIKQKYIETPEKMWEHFEAYRKEVKDNPILKTDYAGKDGDTKKTPLQRPLTFEGFQNWLDDHDIITDVTDYFENKEKRYTAYIRVCSRIKRTIRQDQIEGGMAGIYNPSITQRLNGLKESQDITVHSVEILNIDPLADANTTNNSST